MTPPEERISNMLKDLIHLAERYDLLGIRHKGNYGWGPNPYSEALSLIDKHIEKWETEDETTG